MKQSFLRCLSGCRKHFSRRYFTRGRRREIRSSDCDGIEHATDSRQREMTRKSIDRTAARIDRRAVTYLE